MWYGRASYDRLNVPHSLPKFAVPVMILELDSIPRNATGKVVKSDLRKILKTAWSKRAKDKARL